MKARIIGAAVLAAVLRVAATSATGGTKQAQADITVWLQVDAQSGWPDVVSAATAAFQKQHPGVGVKVQYQTWGTHLGKFDATLAGGNTPDVIEMGNTEMTKYMAAGAFQDLTLGQVLVRQREQLARGPRCLGPLQRQALRRPVLRGLARRHLSHRPVPPGRDQGGAEEPRRVHGGRGEAEQEVRQDRATRRSTSRAPTGTSRWASSTTSAARSPSRSAASGRASSTQPKAIAGLTAFKNFFKAASRASKTADEGRPTPYSVYADGNAGSIVGPGWFSCCVGDTYKSLDGAVRDAEPHRRASRCRASSAAPTWPFRSARTSSSRADWIAAFTSTAAEKALQAKGNIPNTTDAPRHLARSASGRALEAGSSRLRRTG